MSVLLAAVSIAALIPPSSAAAQDAPASTQAATASIGEVVVTGSRIRGVGPVGSAVVGLDQKDITKQGVASTADLLRTVPSVLNIGADPSHYISNQKANANTAFGTGINLRGIGTPDTLVLVDGRRIAPTGIAAYFTDPTAIPESAVQRVEVQADGASAIYGSDAVAGVINIQLRKPFDGAETTARYGGGKGEDQYTVSQVLGKTWDTGGVFFDYEHRYQARLKASSFPDLFTSDFTGHGGPNFNSTSSSPGNIQVGSTFFALPANAGGSPVLASQLTAGTRNLQSFYAGSVDAVPQIVRDSAVLNITQRLTENVKLFAQGIYSDQTFDQLRTTAADGVTSVSIPASNPFYVAGVPGLAPGARETVLYSLVNDLGPLHNTGGEQLRVATFGLTVNPGAGWQIEPTVTYSTDRSDRISHNTVNNCALSGALGGFTLTGQACTGTPAVSDSSSATAFNPFAPGRTNPATLARITGGVRDTTNFDRLNGGVRADGPLFSLPGGTVRLAVGGEYMNDTMSHVQRRNDANFTPDNTQFATFYGKYSRTIGSAYGELYVPIIGAANALPLVRSLDLSVAGRYERYSDVGSTSNPKVGLKWKPIDDLVVHASYGTSFRAPTPADISTTILGTYQVQVLPTVNGIYSSLGPTGQPVNALVMVGGNPTVKPETARTYSFGADYKPQWLEGLALGINYFNVDELHQISAISAGSALSDPRLAPFVTLNPTAAQVAALCANPYFVSANCNGVVAIIDDRSANLGETKTDGFDLSAAYVFNNSLGQWDLDFAGAYVLSYKQAAVPGALLTENVNTVNFPLRFSGRASLGWQRDGWSVTGFVNYQNGYRNATVTPNQNVAAYTTVDLTAGYDIGKHEGWGFVQNTAISVHVTNLLDAKPPFVEYLGNATTPYFAYDPQNASALGRVASVQITKRF